MLITADLERTNPVLKILQFQYDFVQNVFDQKKRRGQTAVFKDPINYRYIFFLIGKVRHYHFTTFRSLVSCVRDLRSEMHKRRIDDIGILLKPFCWDRIPITTVESVFGITFAPAAVSVTAHTYFLPEDDPRTGDGL